MASKLGTAFDCLQLFEGPGLVRLSVAEVASRLAISRSTASVTLAALAEEGYLLREGEGSALAYSMGPRFQRAFAQAILRETARLRDLRDATTRAVDEALGHFGLAAAILDHADLEAARREAATATITDAEAADDEGMPDGAGMAPTGATFAPECGATGGGCS
jgi:DNA-binding transcriptional ArsR family regulator